MITLIEMRWSNVFSYGPDNRISFRAAPLTQVLGKNGHGKSSIALILEEGLYNKNSKGMKKADILNRNNGAKSYTIEIDFDRDGIVYTTKTVRGSTQTVKLFKDGIDISAHTATATYKLIEDLVGYDHKTFAQIIYQSSVTGLQFLVGTDGARKKFLIDLLDLERYTKALEVYKAEAADVSKALTGIYSKISVVQNWLDKYSNVSLDKLELLVVPILPKEIIDSISSSKETLKTIEATNKKIVQNNKYKELLDATVVEPVGQKPAHDIKSLTTKRIELTHTAKSAEQFVQKIRALKGQCPTCYQEIDTSKVASMVQEHTAISETCHTEAATLQGTIFALEAEIKEWETKVRNKQQYEEYHSLIDPSLPSEILDKADIAVSITNNEAQLARLKEQIDKITQQNTVATAHNAKVDVILAQMQDMQAELVEHRSAYNDVSDRLSTLQILVKIFGPNGLIAYKIENLIKDLEDFTNSYLADLSGGRFQLTFKAESDKLNVIVSDNGKDIDILALSNGERARVNTSALLGIRKVLETLSNNRINLLVLDETIDSLDDEGKEKLVEILLAEDSLNTFVISHGFSHPLLEKITVVKINDVSRIE